MRVPIVAASAVREVPYNMETVMKSMRLILATLLMLGSVVGPASAFDTRKFWDEHPTSGQG